MVYLAVKEYQAYRNDKIKSSLNNRAPYISILYASPVFSLHVLRCFTNILLERHLRFIEILYCYIEHVMYNLYDVILINISHHLAQRNICIGENVLFKWYMMFLENFASFYTSSFILSLFMYKSIGLIILTIIRKRNV